MLSCQDLTLQGGRPQVLIFSEGFYQSVSEESWVLFLALGDFPNLFIIYRFLDAISHSCQEAIYHCIPTLDSCLSIVSPVGILVWDSLGSRLVSAGVLGMQLLFVFTGLLRDLPFFIWEQQAVRIMYKSLHDILKPEVRVWKLLVKHEGSSKTLPSLSLPCHKSVIEKGTCTLIAPSAPATSLSVGVQGWWGDKKRHS